MPLSFPRRADAPPRYVFVDKPLLGTFLACVPTQEKAKEVYRLVTEHCRTRLGRTPTTSISFQHTEFGVSVYLRTPDADAMAVVETYLSTQPFRAAAK